MAQTSSHVAQISSQRVKLLLELGLAPESKAQTATASRLVSEAVNDSSGESLRQLATDLKALLPGDEAGPWSLARLTGLTAEEAQPLAGKSPLELLTEPAATMKVLRALADYGEVFTATAFPRSTRVAGAVIHALALAQLEMRCGATLEKEEQSSVAAIVGMVGQNRVGQ